MTPAEIAALVPAVIAALAAVAAYLRAGRANKQVQLHMQAHCQAAAARRPQPPGAGNTSS